MKNSCAFTALLTLIVLPGAAPAWDDEGHMIVAALAYDRLDSSVRARADALVRMNAQYQSWTGGVATASQGKVAFMKAATWPDYIKTAPGYKNDKDPTGPDAARNIGYGDHLQHRYWHYKDLPLSQDGTPTKNPTEPNAQTQIDAFRAVLADPNASDALKSFDLVWLLHLVGDVHQPLHAASRFAKATPHGDEGGNLVCLGPTMKGRCPTLHAFWDDILGTSKRPTAAMASAKKLSLPAGAPDLSTANWLEESEQIALARVYIKPILGGKGPYKVTKAYRTMARAAARERVVLAGARLAAILNQELK